jgi:signal transduction histidine kinase
MKEQQTWLREGKITRRCYERQVIKKTGEKVLLEAVPSLVKKDEQIVGIYTVSRDITRQRQKQENMQNFLAKISSAQEKERKHIAHDLHDGVVQELASLSLDIESLIRDTTDLPQSTTKRLKQVQSKLNETTISLRRFSHRLRPDVLDRLGLAPALETLTKELCPEGVILYTEIAGTGRRLPPEIELALFRIAQETLRNVRKHALATEVLVKVKFSPHKVSLTIADNGRGFRIPKATDDFVNKGKLGLIGMQERTRSVGGTFTIKSQPGKGTEITVGIKT